jgi:Zn-dependent peptidase ImmA (M78 family)
MPVRVERFVEKHFKLGGVRYETLPASVLGCTIFEAGEVREIAVSRSLCDDPSKVAERRLRTTLAHEAGHGLLHATLFRERYEPSLFDGSEAVQKDKILCRDGEAAARYNGNWWEVQANMMIGALLLPKSLVQEVVGPHTTESVLGASDLPAEKRYAVSRELAEVFDVNPVVAQIRLETLLPLARSDQLTL